MLLTLKMVKAEFGGVIEYAKEHCGLSTKTFTLFSKT